MDNQYLSFAIKLANEVGQLILPNAGIAGQQTMKSEKDFVTEMDLKAEKLIIDRIKEQYPQHHIFSEEIGRIEGTEEFEWVIDPIDGTVNYSMGLPFYGISIALIKNKEPIVAAISLPALGEIFWAAKGEGAILNGRTIKVRDADISEAFVSFGDFARDGNIEISC
ncbi:inositol monophosphatase family protein [Neobacillus cucumis]|uniref:inositol monophosphatase family protein n=1 Tax=Neobacillus cucumis TaxID=1740721 RepID=UPI00285319BE|nr:inositol monophosphatase [Neobacillus cucumis]MDR4950496.1 inositol monophosphatase [Neobacillus cucumis]